MSSKIQPKEELLCENMLYAPVNLNNTPSYSELYKFADSNFFREHYDLIDSFCKWLILFYQLKKNAFKDRKQLTRLCYYL